MIYVDKNRVVEDTKSVEMGVSQTKELVALSRKIWRRREALSC